MLVRCPVVILWFPTVAIVAGASGSNRACIADRPWGLPSSAKQPIVDVLANIEQSLIINALSVHGRHVVTIMPHDQVDSHLILRPSCDRFKRVPQRVEVDAMPFQLQIPKQLSELRCDQITS